jgi:hypothetical protein
MNVLLVVCSSSVTPFRLERVAHDDTSGDVHQALLGSGRPGSNRHHQLGRLRFYH